VSRLWIAGVPAPQGSKRHVGRGIMRESSKAVGPWRERIAGELAQLLGEGHEPTRAAVVVNARFVFLRPKSHLRTNGEPRPSAPRVPATRPDLDKLMRAVLDAMAGVAFADDGQVVAINAGKEYGNAAGLDLSWSVIA
jgi:crossover junction endodeoxyribonuclease RusA